MQCRAIIVIAIAVAIALVAVILNSGAERPGQPSPHAIDQSQ